MGTRHVLGPRLHITTFMSDRTQGLHARVIVLASTDPTSFQPIYPLSVTVTVERKRDPVL